MATQSPGDMMDGIDEARMDHVQEVVGEAQRPPRVEEWRRCAA